MEKGGKKMRSRDVIIKAVRTNPHTEAEWIEPATFESGIQWATFEVLLDIRDKLTEEETYVLRPDNFPSSKKWVKVCSCGAAGKDSCTCNDRPITVTVDVNGKEFQDAVRKIADEVRVEAERRNAGTRRLYVDMVCMVNTCRFDISRNRCFPGPGDDCSKCSSIRKGAKEKTKVAKKDYADMLSKNQKGAPFDEYGYTEMKTIFERDHPKAYADMVRHSNGLINWQNDGNIFHAHPTAIIDNASVGKNTKIWHFSHICDGANIGENCTIGQNVFIGEGVSIGRGCKIQNNVFIPEGVEIEPEVFIGPSVTFTNVTNPRAFISRKDEFKSTIVRIGASIGAAATILCDNAIGRYAMIGAGAVVTKDIGDFQVAFGNPAKVVGTINIDGSRIHYFE